MEGEACSSPLPVPSEPGLGGTRQAMPGGFQGGGSSQIPGFIHLYLSHRILSCMEQCLHNFAAQLQQGLRMRIHASTMLRTWEKDSLH